MRHHIPYRTTSILQFKGLEMRTIVHTYQAKFCLWFMGCKSRSLSWSVYVPGKRVTDTLPEVRRPWFKALLCVLLAL